MHKEEFGSCSVYEAEFMSWTNETNGMITELACFLSVYKLKSCGSRFQSTVLAKPTSNSKKKYLTYNVDTLIR